MVDVVYIAAAAHDARFTRICVASVRRFYPTVPIRLLAGGPLEPGLAEELARHFAVEVAALPRHDHGWGFVKLEPLFLPPGQRFLVLDSDTVITGPVLAHAAEQDADFIVDDEATTDDAARAIYFDAARAGPDGGPVPRPAFLFNSGQWFGRSGLIDREAFAGLVRWGPPPRAARPDVFKNGEQGIFNFVLGAQTAAGRVRTARVPLMRWPGHGMHGLDAAAVASGACPALVVHWAGMKHALHRRMPGADVLDHYEARYYERLPGGGARRRLAQGRAVLGAALRRVRTALRHRLGRT